MPADPDGDNMTVILFIISAVFFIFGILYSVCDAALRHGVIKSDEEEKENKLREKLLKISDENDGILSPLRLGSSLSNAAFTLINSFAFRHFFSTAFNFLGESELKEPLGIILSGLVFFTCFLIFAKFLPKKLVAVKAQIIENSQAKLIMVMNALMFPYYKILSFISDIILRIFGVDSKNIQETVTEDEIMQIVGEGEESGAIEEDEKDRIENILDFSDTLVSSLMTHRIDIAALPDTASIEEAVELSVERGFSRIPVYHEDIDTIVGILYIKDLIPYCGKQMPQFIKLTDLLRPTYFIPVTKKCSSLFTEMTEKKVQIAIIVDEYGGTNGLISLEDLVESILGNIQDEYDNEEEEITIVSDTEFTVDGAAPIDEIEDLINTKIPEGDYDTIGGFVTDYLGRILKEDETPTIETDDLIITVKEVKDQRISELFIVKKPENDKENKDEDKKAEKGKIKENKKD
ncbi:MAG: HlyC/CorC family transporter [Ruminococcaceae bacterium]|nr:HlyC/CorC family transporter [Oscillospiraceae bacterium]